MNEITRREALRLLGAAAFELPLLSSLACSREAPASLECEEVTGLLRSQGAAVVLGQRWLVSLATAPSAETLLASLIAELPAASASAAAPRDRLRSDLVRRHRLDFAEGNTLRLEGWLLSRTELRLYGLAALCGEAWGRTDGDPDDAKR